MRIRDAALADAESICAVLRRSISELCHADHGGDPAILNGWLFNKTPENVALWLAQPGAYVLVALDEKGAIVAVGGMSASGEINLNYVLPDARFRGFSKALMRALEDRARERGLGACRLTSTKTAQRFYLSAGYCEESACRDDVGRDATRLRKTLTTAAQPART
jgi:GNAT superfamily N-acetyltransferase